MRTLTVTLVILYSAVVFKPLLTIVDFQLRRDFIAAVLCINKDKPETQCNGKCYLNEKLAEDSGENQGTEKSTNSKTQEEEVHLDHEFSYSIVCYATSNDVIRVGNERAFASLSYDIETPPPQIA